MFSCDTKRLAQIHQQRFFEYIAVGRLYKIRLLLEDENCNIDVNRFDENAMTPLMLACELEDDKVKTRNQILRLLLDKGADLNIPDQRGLSIFSWACKTGRNDIVKLFVKKSMMDIDFNRTDAKGDTALMYAVQTQNAPLVRILVRAMRKLDVDVDKRNQSDVTPYLEAKRIGNEEIMAILKNDGNASESIQICPLYQNEESPSPREGDVKGTEIRYRPTLASKMRQALSVHNKKEWMAYRKTWNVESRVNANIVAKNDKNTRQRVKSAGNISVRNFRIQQNLMDKAVNIADDRKGGRNVADMVDEKETVDGKEERRSVDRSKRPKTSHHFNRKSASTMASITTKIKDIGINDAGQIPLEGAAHEDKQREQEDALTNEIEAGKIMKHDSEAKIGLDSVNNKANPERVQSRIGKSEAEDNKIDHDVFNSDVDKSLKLVLQKRLQRRTPTRIRSSDSIDKLGHDRPMQYEFSEKCGSLGGIFHQMTQEAQFAPQLPRGKGSINSASSVDNLSTTLSRPNSSMSDSKRHNAVTFQRPRSADIRRPKVMVSYEDIYEVCPEMRHNGKRQWYTDLQWMLAMKAQQNIETYLPAQPDRQLPLDDAPSSSSTEVKIEAEMPRLARRTSVIGDIKRPGLRKRQTTMFNVK
eukprot:gene13858-15306_t